MSQRIDHFDIRDLFFILKKRLALLIVLSLFCGAAGFYLSYWVIRPKYESTATLLIRADDINSSASLYEKINASLQLVNTYSIILKSDRVIAQIIDDLGLNVSEEKISDAITIEKINDTGVMNVTVVYTDPRTAYDIATKMIEIAPVFIAQTVSVGTIILVSGAKIPENPVSPNLYLYSAVGLAVGFVAAVFISLSRELLNTRITSEDDVLKFLNCSVLSFIPVMKKSERIAYNCGNFLQDTIKEPI